MVDQCLTGASNADVEGTHRDRRHIGWLSIDDVLDLSTTSATIHGPPCIFYHTYGDAAVNLYHSLQLAQRQENRTVYAAVNLKQNLRSMYCTIETNHRHEASRGFFATAELLVLNRFSCFASV